MPQFYSAVVTGSGGFIGHQLVKFLKDKGHFVRGIDLKPPQYDVILADEFCALDLREYVNCQKAVDGMEVVFHLAADMGGIGFITSHYASVTRNNALMTQHMLEASRQANVERFFFSSSACIYPHYLQDTTEGKPLKESDAYPAQPEPGYGLEKLFSEELCRYYCKDYGLKTRIARFHNIYGPMGTFDGGREKVIAAICRKIAKAKSGDNIEVWGDGLQTRSFMYVRDCVAGIYELTNSDYEEPLNIGNDRLVTINELVDIVAQIAEKKIHKQHDVTKPQGVRGRNSDNSLRFKVLGHEQDTPLEDGLAITYSWIREQVT